MKQNSSTEALDPAAVAQDFNAREQRRLQHRDRVYNDSVVLGLDKARPRLHGGPAFNRLQSLMESGKKAHDLREELRKHSFKFGDWNGNRLNKSCDTTTNRTALEFLKQM